MKAMQRSIECLPESICSWNFDMMGFESIVHLEWEDQGGRLIRDKEISEFAHDDEISNLWLMRRGGQILYNSTLIEADFSVVISDTAGAERARWRVVKGRTVSVEGEEVSVQIRPAHFWTRRGYIEGVWQCDDLVAFSFWITSRWWKRDWDRYKRNSYCL